MKVLQNKESVPKPFAGKTFFVISVNLLSWLYLVFAICYGMIFVWADLSQTVNFNTVAEASVAHKFQILYFTPYIIIGMALLLILAVFYCFRKNGVGKNAWRIFFASIISFATAYLIVTTIIAVYIKEIACLLYIIPDLLLLSYAIYSFHKIRSATDNVRD